MILSVPLQWIKKLKIMARPIKETPVVTGKDAKRFAEKMAHLKPESKEEKEAAKKVYEKFKAIAAFTFWYEHGSWRLLFHTAESGQRDKAV